MFIIYEHLEILGNRDTDKNAEGKEEREGWRRRKKGREGRTAQET